MANVYAGDDAQARFPSWPLSSSGENPTDVTPSFVTNLVTYGFNMPLFFCPVRPTEFTYAQNWFQGEYNRPMQTMNDLNTFFESQLSCVYGGVVYHGRSETGTYSKLYHDWWVPRYNLLPPQPQIPTVFFPSLTTTATTHPATCIGWPTKMTDLIAGRAPIVSDIAETLAGQMKISEITNGEAHFFNSALDSINVCFGDGHVELHNKATIQWQYTAQSSYFY
jgi:prepilin-type processing-associated H-X9-DG protein